MGSINPAKKEEKILRVQKPWAYYGMYIIQC